jgi:hypothetical protein
MRLLRAGTLRVTDPTETAKRYVEWFNYRVVEEGIIGRDLACSWDSPRVEGHRYIVLQPESGTSVYLRLVAGDPVAGYEPLRTYGWAALEICVSDVLAVERRLRESPFRIIGPPREIDGLPTIYPMQVQGPDQEIVYLTQIRGDLPAYDLPRAASLVDNIFIMVLACSNLDASSEWFRRHVLLESGRKMDIVYSMLAKAFAAPPNTLYTINTLTHERDVFLELDQYPDTATTRPGYALDLPAGISLATLIHPQFDALPGPWIESPRIRSGVIYDGRRSGTLRGLDGTLIEVVSAE